jgi:hypothetical protein|tara:strand:+ start:17 stop:256 length:240 start_codon:yes stop_codon:yes gene_type:complete
LSDTKGDDLLIHRVPKSLINKRRKNMKKYTVIQTYTAEDIYKNVEAESKEEAILKIGELSVDEQNHEDTETEVKLQEEE